MFSYSSALIKEFIAGGEGGFFLVYLYNIFVCLVGINLCNVIVIAISLIFYYQISNKANIKFNFHYQYLPG